MARGQKLGGGRERESSPFLARPLAFDRAPLGIITVNTMLRFQTESSELGGGGGWSRGIHDEDREGYGEKIETPKRVKISSRRTILG